jgi:hypothetical protein
MPVISARRAERGIDYGEEWEPAGAPTISDHGTAGEAFSVMHDPSSTLLSSQDFDGSFETRRLIP